MAGKQWFIRTFSDFARAASERCGILPEVILAQSALETGWGAHAPHNNYFGIKGPGGTFETREFINGHWITEEQNFAGYRSAEAGFLGYADFINDNPRYADMQAAETIDDQITELGKSGYATAPDYADMIREIVAGLVLAPPVHAET